MQSNLEKKLKETSKTNPLTKAEKNLLWTKIENNINQKPLLQPLTIFGLKSKLVFASLMSIALIGTSAAVVGASNDAGPGDLLYPIDIAIERIQLALSKKENKDNLRLKFAEERLKEAQRVLVFQNDNNSESITISTSTENNFQRIKKANNTLSVALKKLETTKNLLEKKGNIIAIAAVNEIITELTELAEDHVSDLDDFEAEIKNNGKRKVEINNFRNNLKIKFKIDFNNNSQKGEQGLEKVVICHVPSGDPDNAHTITIARAAVQSHLNHGDTLGPCEGVDQQDDDATSTQDIIAPVISNISFSASINTVDIIWNTDEASNSKVWYSTTTPIVLASSLFIESTNLVASHAISLSNLNTSTTYYFIVGSDDGAGNKATSTELSFTTLIADTTAPVISNINSSVSISTADISWDTDEASDSAVWYSTTTPIIILSNALYVDSNNLVTNHTISLSSLSANTTYYFIVSSLDSSGNKATSTEYSFTTLTLDTIAPVISNISSSVSTNTADIIWNTDEASNSKIWYSTTTPIVLASSLFIESTNLVASHAISLSGLNASTTYYFIVGSDDDFGNKATSTELFFTTL